MLQGHRWNGYEAVARPRKRQPRSAATPFRHCEERSDEAIQGVFMTYLPWIASPSARNDVALFPEVVHPIALGDALGGLCVFVVYVHGTGPSLCSLRRGCVNRIAQSWGRLGGGRARPCAIVPGPRLRPTPTLPILGRESRPHPVRGRDSSLSDRACRTPPPFMGEGGRGPCPTLRHRARSASSPHPGTAPHRRMRRRGCCGDDPPVRDLLPSRCGFFATRADGIAAPPRPVRGAPLRVRPAVS
jgi:hypothetical protein